MCTLFLAVAAGIMVVALHECSTFVKLCKKTLSSLNCDWNHGDLYECKYAELY